MTCVTGRLAAIATAAAAACLAAEPPGEPLEPERAFPVEGHVTPGGIDLTFRIADGYYLYGGRFRLEVDPGLPVGAAKLPTGEVKQDPFIGRTEILRGSASVHLPFTGNARPGSYRVQVTAQGCAEGRVCYAPFTQVVRLTVAGAP